MARNDIKIMGGNANLKLAAEIANYLRVPLLDSKVGRFADGEIQVMINELVRGSDVFIIQSTCPPVNENLMELLVMTDALKRSSCARVTAVMPYFGYARQDRKARARDPISAKLVANLLTTAGVDRILTMDLHAPQIQGFFDIPVDHLEGLIIFSDMIADIMKGQDKSDFILVAPDMGSVSRIRKMADLTDLQIAIIDKRREKANECEVMNIIGDIEGKTAIIIDDMIDTAGTITKAANTVVDMGAKRVLVYATHGILSANAVSKIKNSKIEKMYLLDTVPVPEEKMIDKLEIVNVAKLFSEAIYKIYTNTSMSALFKMPPSGRNEK
ncbi:MAG TPA: ribose-phosphate pyrophosphokinase [Clostridia bacterium]|nr:ribose-phosphate pyrophosphokinase [Clostridia bacterium]HOM35001.1 ribose-phosphate pyrophosphokinase [Clostridia bacterium]HOR90270.1 ribose-phosphate pyrophosphokinase [Clostridia bacterium]HOT70749.1 ribose-phosphate pyrophosphokinase [Clostridia bacterium]HPL08394.1 ribose-phosphate pyrophosphokinase [Clostridia bacterium]